MRIRYAALLVSLVLLSALLTGCASSVPFQKTDIEPGKALIYVFRPESVLARGEMFKLEINGAMQGMLLNNAYIPVHVAPGSVNLAIHKNSPLSSPLLASLKLTTRAGGTYYVKAIPGMAWTVELLQLDEKQGAKEIGSKVFYQAR